jgi:hypothetical protein
MLPKVQRSSTQTALTVGIALVWLINGFFCKVINLVPRHQLIVSRISGEEYSFLFTKTIGVLEILMAAWIASGVKPKLCVITQIMVIAIMNLIEFLVVPDLLLFGRVNCIVAAFFILLIALNEFLLKKPGYALKKIN